LDIIPTVNLEGVLSAFNAGKRRCLLEGGTSSSKTYGALQAIVLIAQEAIEPLLISVVSESLPHLRRGAIRDFFDIIGESQVNNPFFSRTEFLYFRSGWKGRIEFFGADDSSKVRGPRRDILFMNEGNNIPWETARGLDIRTSRFTIVDWNPVSEFWAHEFWKDEPGNDYIHSTYLDARDVIPRQLVCDIESYRDKDPNWWNIYGLGLTGKISGLVYQADFKQVDALPQGDYFYGLDYGFSSDPTVLVKNVLIGDNLYSEQMFYSDTPMTNDDIAREMTLLNVSCTDPIFPDPNEPKSAEEIRRKGFNVEDSEKGPGSVKFGIKRVNAFYQHWTKSSLECIKEQRNYRYIKKKEPGGGEEYLSDETTHKWSHGMDARRYAVASHRLVTRRTPVTTNDR